MLHHDPAATKRRYADGLRALARAAPGDLGACLSRLLAPDVRWMASHPLGEVSGRSAVEHQVWRPLKAAFPDLERRDDIFVGGSHHGEDWIAATGHYFGTFQQSFLGIPPTRGWASLRFGEFFRLEDGQAVECFVLWDLLDLMRQADVYPWRRGRGVETFAPGPATRDGVRLEAPDGGETEKTLRLMQSMLGPLFEPDRESMGMERFWHPDMMWYGPCGIGTTRGLDGFFRYHTDPWVEAIPDWRADLDTPHFADDTFSAFLGWPSIKATHTGAMLGLPATGRSVEINLMDFYRRDGALLAENWIFIDFPHLFLQLGVDLFERMAERRDRDAGRRTEEPVDALR